jgi:hypothetical protein
MANIKMIGQLSLQKKRRSPALSNHLKAAVEAVLKIKYGRKIMTANKRSSVTLNKINIYLNFKVNSPIIRLTSASVQNS